MSNSKSAAQIRQEFIDFFTKKKTHTFVPSSSLVPGGDATLLFTNAGMVQFKDVFLGTDKREYTRAVNSQKCMRVAGKHNDLEDVGQDDTHHTFFEMLGNWSFGDYYKKEAIEWAWELLTEVWGLEKDRIYATVFKDELGEIPTDDDAANFWRQQPEFIQDHLLYLGRKDNFWEMADTGPCGPCSEIHYDLGPEFGELEYREGGQIDLDSGRFVELWNLVFIQYNRTGPSHLDPLPATHVDTGMGLERLVSILQNKTSNYRTDLFSPTMTVIQELAGHTDEQKEDNFTPYRVIADHARAATFLIADGVVPGNVGRNYVCRMIIRRAARFGSKIGLDEPFLARVADSVIENYAKAYPELIENKAAVLDNLTREEERFQRTVEAGIAHLENLLKQLESEGKQALSGDSAFDLYATYGLPLEITRDIAQERGLGVDEYGFQEAMETHRLASGAGQAMGDLGGEGIERFQKLAKTLLDQGDLSPEGVVYDPYGNLEVEGPILAILVDGEQAEEAHPGDKVSIILPETCFYVAAGGQVADAGMIVSVAEPRWEIKIEDVLQPVRGVIVHVGEVIKGTPRVGDEALAAVDQQRRRDIMRNHTATHLLHTALRTTLGDHARQAGSLVAPDRLRFDFTHPEALTADELAQIEAHVNRNIQENYTLQIGHKPLEQAKAEGAIALFGEKYGELVRNVRIGDFSNELCGGTHVFQTGDIGIFLITSESSAAAGIRRIEAVTGRMAYELVQKRFRGLQHISDLLKTTPGQVMEKTQGVLAELNTAQKTISQLRKELAGAIFSSQLESVPQVAGVHVLTSILPGADIDTLRQMADRFRQRYSTGVVVLAGAGVGNPVLVATVTEDLTKRGLHAGELIRQVAQPLGGSGGGRPTMAQAGGKDASKLKEALEIVPAWVEKNLEPAN